MKRLLACLVALAIGIDVQAAESIRLANNPALSPDGQWLAFDWNGDIWLAPSAGGEAKPRTANSARDTHPRFSPDGKDIAFVSDRDGSAHIYTIPLDGPTGRLTAAAGWSPWRPSHTHLIVSAEGHEPLVTQLFIDTSDYLHDDVASAVKDELIVHPEPTGKGDELGFSYDFVLAPVHAPVPVG